MKWKVSEFGYYCLNVLYGLVFLLWLWLLTVSPIRSTDDLLGSLRLLTALEGMFFLCSPVLQRKVTIDESFVTERWMWCRIDRVALSDIRDIGLCVTAVSGHVRQYVFLSAFPVTDAEAIRLYEEKRWKRKGFIVIDHPQKGLEACVKQMAQTCGLPFRCISRDLFQ